MIPLDHLIIFLANEILFLAMYFYHFLQTIFRGFRCPVHNTYVFCWIIEFIFLLMQSFSILLQRENVQWIYWCDAFSSTALEGCCISEYVSRLENYMLPRSPPFIVFPSPCITLSHFSCCFILTVFRDFSHWHILARRYKIYIFLWFLPQRSHCSAS